MTDKKIYQVLISAYANVAVYADSEEEAVNIAVDHDWMVENWVTDEWKVKESGTTSDEIRQIIKECSLVVDEDGEVTHD